MVSPKINSWLIEPLKLRFIIVGSLAAAVHFLTLLCLVANHCCRASLANIVAFVVAMQLSYWGHRCWTFQTYKKQHSVTMSRFLLIALIFFFANEGLFVWLIQQFGLPYYLANLLVLLILPILSFYLNKLWVFN
jgi:putative flippase GtrA